MVNKKLFLSAAVVSILVLFAVLVSSNGGFKVSIGVNTTRTGGNVSGTSVLLQATMNGTITSSADNVTFSFYNVSGGLYYNITINATALGNGAAANQTFNTTINTRTLFADGYYNLTVNGTNASRTSGVYTLNDTVQNITMDNTFPNVTINSPANGSYIGPGTTLSYFVFNATVADGLTGVRDVNLSNTTGPASFVQIRGNYYNTTYNYSQLVPGENFLYVYANDSAGNLNSSVYVRVYVDTSAPTAPQLRSPANYTWTSKSMPDFSFNYTDNESSNASCELFLNSSSGAVGYGINASARNNTLTVVTANHSLTAGVYSWYVNCTDLGGNVNTSARALGGPTYFEYVVITASPLNNSYTNDTRAGNNTFTLSFTSGLANGTHSDGLNTASNISCQLLISARNGAWLNNTVNTTVKNATAFTLNNNNSLFDGLATNWTVNCTWNGTSINLSTGHYVLNVDNTTPSYSVSPAASNLATTTATLTATTNESGTCRYSASSIIAYAGMTNFDSTGGTSHTTALSGLSAGNSYTYYVRCKDLSQLPDSGLLGQVSFSTTADTASGSGSGGAGGGASAGAVGQFAQETWASINTGETATVEVANGAIGVTEVSFSVTDNTYGAWVKVEKADALPTAIASFDGAVYKQIKITESNVEKVLKDTAKIDFKVEKSWLTEKKLGKTDVALFRSVNNEWVQLKTTVGTEDGTYVHYTAETPGFSYFVIGHKLGTTTTAATTTSAATEAEAAAAEAAALAGVAAEAATGTTSTSSSWPWVVGIIVVLGVIAGAYFFMKKK